MKYRADIDGLRTFAVVPVVLFHAGLSGFSGGFVGVDIFFVISGYLITRSLLEDIGHGGLSIPAFYERRILRLYPALFFTLFSTFAAAWLLFPPIDFYLYAKSLVATVFFASNILFFTEANYFDGSAELKPLLHTWSLAVEEQFYIFFPLILAFITRFMNRWRGAAIAVIGAVSLAISVWATSNAPTFNFYLPITRAWELLLGSALAIGAVPELRSAAARNALALLGLVLIVVPVWLYSSDTPFPGLSALAPTLGATLLIHSAQDTVVGRMLSLKPIVYIGRISYSLYLWHWPIIVFTRFYELQHLGPIATFGVIAGSFVMAAISLHFVEAPFRRKNRFTRRQVFLAAAAGSSMLVLLGGAVVLTQGMEFRNPEAARFTRSVADDLARFHAAPCLRTDGRVPAPGECLLGAPGTPSVVLWGDSHAAQLAPSLDALARQRGFTVQQVTKAGCAPIQAASYTPYSELRRDCPAFGRAALERILTDPAIRVVVMAGRWDMLAAGHIRATSLGGAETVEQSQRLASESLETTARLLNARGIRVIVVDQIPLPEVNPFVCVRAAVYNGLDPARCDTFEARHSHDVQDRISQTILDRVAKVGGNTSILDMRDALCSGTTCRARLNGQLLYMDDVHLSRLGSDVVAARLRPVLAERLSRN
ncbi:peptidoglycan/LPS O-acetylase OafA/YrhL [Sphingomonas zeicaulis]|uniref:acyltransferase family protein n=1 Tax=Sphingomonas zeicaulis TaxID=1632740 RepID=UPI003D21C807